MECMSNLDAHYVMVIEAMLMSYTRFDLFCMDDDECT